MSTYRTLGRVQLNDVYAEKLKTAGDASPEQAAASASHAHQDEAAKLRRRGEPANVALPRTRAWEAALRSRVTLTALMRTYPRIANVLAVSWNDPAATSAYLEELLVDRRGNRRGFPPDVLAELDALRAFHEKRHPGTHYAWELPNKRD